MEIVNNTAITNPCRTILEQAQDIVYNRKDTNGDRPYGPFSQCMKKAAEIFNAISPTTVLQAGDVYRVLMALKLAREYFEHKQDNLIDLCGYAAGLDDYINEINNSNNF